MAGHRLKPAPGMDLTGRTGPYPVRPSSPLIGEVMADQRIEPGDLAGLEFRRRGSAVATAAEDTLRNLWWQIALGGFLALMAHSLVTGLYARYELAQLNKQIEAETKKASQQLQQQIDLLQGSTPGVPQRYQPSPLRDSERCISGRRFVRVDNGWRQVMEPC